MILYYVLVFLISFFISFLLIPILIKFAIKNNIVDEPNERKVHKNPTPRIGGIAIFLGFIIVIPILFFKPPAVIKTSYLYGLLSSLSLIAILGFIDDIIGLRAWQKLIFQVIFSFIAMYFGFIINQITIPIPYNILTINFNRPVSIVFTLFWIIGITNAINLLDGLDGFAGGIVGISMFFLFLISMHTGAYFQAVLTISIIGSIIGFLKYNFYPARIFMGDTGSLFLGFSIALFSILGGKSSVAITLIIPISLLIIPITDTFLSIFRRIKRRQKIFSADKKHIHHRLLELRLPYKYILLIVYTFNIIVGILSYLMVIDKNDFMVFIFLVAFLLIASLIVLNIFERKKNIQ